MFQIGLKKFFWLKKFKTLFRGHMLLVILTEKKFVGTFDEKELQKTSQKGFKLEKLRKRKGEKLYFKWKGTIVFLTAGLIKKT